MSVNPPADRENATEDAAVKATPAGEPDWRYAILAQEDGRVFTGYLWED